MRRVFLAILFVVGLAPLTADARALLVVGDSLSAAYGMDLKSGWVSLLAQRLKRQQLDYTVINASISGDTTANGLDRLPKLLAEHQPQIVVIELGGNDGLRGLSLDEMKDNITTMVRKAKARNALVLLVGVRLPPNYGKRYAQRFQRIYQDVAGEQNIALAPFILDGVAINGHLMQADGVHPKANAQRRVMENIWPHLRPLLLNKRTKKRGRRD